MIREQKRGLGAGLAQITVPALHKNIMNRSNEGLGIQNIKMVGIKNYFDYLNTALLRRPSSEDRSDKSNLRGLHSFQENI